MLGDEWYASRPPSCYRPRRPRIPKPDLRTDRERTSDDLARWGLHWAFDESDGATTLVLADVSVPAAAGVHVAADGKVTVVESVGHDAEAFGAGDPEAERLALLGLVDDGRPEGDWGRWRPGRRIRDPSDPAWYAVLWSLGVAGRVVGGKDASTGIRSSLAEAVGRAGGDAVRKRLLDVLPDDPHGLPHPTLGIASLVAGAEEIERDDLDDAEPTDPDVVRERRRAALSAVPLFARTIASNPHLLKETDAVGGVPLDGLRSPALWGVGCSALRREPAWRGERILALGRVPFPLGSTALRVLAVSAAAVPPGHVPTEEGEFRAFEVVAGAVEEMPSFREEFYRGASGRRHDLAAMLAPAKGRWTRYLSRVLAAGGREDPNWRRDLMTYDTKRQAFVTARLARTLRRSQDVGEAFAKEILVPFVVVENEIMASSASSVNAWRSLGSSALFRGADLVRIVSTWRRWTSGKARRKETAIAGGSSWPVPFEPFEAGARTVVAVGTSHGFAGRTDSDGLPLARCVFDCMAGRAVLVETRDGDRAATAAAFEVSFPENGGNPAVDLLWHVAYGEGAPAAADMAAVGAALARVAAFDAGTDEAWRSWVRDRRERGGSYAWLVPTANYRFDEPALRASALDWWRPFLPGSAKGADEASLLGRFEPEAVATMRHLKAAGVLMFPYWQRSFRSGINGA